MIFIHRPSSPPVFTEDPLRKRQQLRIREWFSNAQDQRGVRTFGVRWADSIPRVMEELRAVFVNKCVYCEVIIDNEPDAVVLNFFRPPEGALQVDGTVDPDHYWWLSWEWSNLYLACATCGRNKGNKFPTNKGRAQVGSYGSALQREEPLLIDPCLENPSDYLIFKESGDVFCKEGSDRGKLTIDILDLNRDELRARRETKAKEIKILLQECLRATAANNGTVLPDTATRINELAAQCETAQLFAGMTRQLLLRWLHEAESSSETIHDIHATPLDDDCWRNLIDTLTQYESGPSQDCETLVFNSIKTPNHHEDIAAVPHSDLSDRSYTREREFKKTVLELDLVGFSSTALTLEQNIGPKAVADLHQQIQNFIDQGLRTVGASRLETVAALTGDGAILIFDNAETAHRFALSVHEATQEHNRGKTELSALRLFRMGAATGNIVMEPRVSGGYDIAGVTIARAVRLEAAARTGELVIDVNSFDSLPPSLRALYSTEERIKGKRAEEFVARRCVMNADVPVTLSSLPAPSHKGASGTRRNILELFKKLEATNLERLIFLLEIPIKKQPPKEVNAEEREDRILRYFSTIDDGLVKLESELRYLIEKQEAESHVNP